MTKAGWPFSSLIDKVYLPFFQQHGESAIPSLVNGKVSSMALLSAYKYLPPIETMPPNEKTEMKKYINELFKGETPSFRLRACKIVYAIGNLI